MVAKSKIMFLALAALLVALKQLGAVLRVLVMEHGREIKLRQQLDHRLRLWPRQ